MRKFLSNVLIIISLLFISGYKVEIKNNALPFGKEMILEEEEEKLVFETSDSAIQAESASGEIADKLNDVSDYVSVAVELDDWFDEAIEEPDYPVSVEEAQKIVKEHREKSSLYKENERMVRELGLGFGSGSRDKQIYKFCFFKLWGQVLVIFISIDSKPYQGTIASIKLCPERTTEKGSGDDSILRN